MIDKSEEILKLEREQLKFQKDNLGLFQDLIKGQSIIKEQLNDMKVHHAKNFMVVMAIVFLSGVLIGTQYTTWLPYVDTVTATLSKANKAKDALK